MEHLIYLLKSPRLSTVYKHKTLFTLQQYIDCPHLIHHSYKNDKRTVTIKYLLYFVTITLTNDNFSAVELIDDSSLAARLVLVVCGLGPVCV